MDDYKEIYHFAVTVAAMYDELKFYKEKCKKLEKILKEQEELRNHNFEETKRLAGETLSKLVDLENTE